MIQKKTNKKTYKIVLIILVLVLFCLRIINLDSDLPVWRIAYYTPLDEGAYAMQSIQNVSPETMDKIDEIDGGEYNQWNSSISLLTTIFCTVTLKIFGDNYYGLRLSAFFAAFIVFILALLLTNDIAKRNWLVAMVFVGLAFITDFSFMLASRIVEPSIFRMLAVFAGVFAYYKYSKNDNHNYFIYGIISIASLILGYITNMFIFFGFGIMIILDSLVFKKKFFKNVFNYILGIVAGYIISEGLYYLFQKRFFYQNILRIMFYSDGRVSLTLKAVHDNILAFSQTNMFSYNSAFFALAIAAFLYVLISGIKNKDKFRLFLSALISGYVLQSLFTSDYLMRKSIVIFPLIIICIVYLINDMDSIKTWVKSKNVLTKLLIYGGFLLVCAFAIYNSYFRIVRIPSGDMTSTFKKIILVCNALALAVMALYVLIVYFEKTKIKIARLLLVCLLIPSLILSYKYIWTAKETEKETMIKLQEIVGEDYVLGGHTYAYSFYNNMIWLSHSYDSYYVDDYNQRAKYLLEMDEVKYYIGYLDEEKIAPWLEGTDYEWELVERFYTGFNIKPGEEAERDIYLYKKVKITE